jgi:hypothetical protein
MNAPFQEQFGKPLSRAELAAREYNRYQLQFLDDEDKPDFETMPEEALKDWQPYHVGWRYHRNGSTGINGDEWYPGDSWTAERIIRPSYDQFTAVKLKLTIYGKKKPGGRLRANRFFASLEFAWQGGWSLGSHMYCCTSVADALRRADKLSFDAEIAEMLKRYYSPEQAKAVYRLKRIYEYETPPSPDDTKYQPWASTFRNGSWENLPSGRYLEVGWDLNWKTKKYGLNGSFIERDYGGYSGGALSFVNKNGHIERVSSHEEHQREVEKYGTWLVKPRDPP